MRCDKIKRQPNTLDCHRLILWAGNTGNAARMKQRLMELYFTEGADLTDREVLVKAAADCGMDADACARRLASDDDVERVDAEAEPPRRPASTACPASSSAACSRSGRAAPEIWRRRSSARPTNTPSASRPNSRFDQNNGPRARRDASTSIALAAIHEPRMRTPIRCHPRVKSVHVPAMTAADPALRQVRCRSA